jgi:hypothetical protein
MTDASAGLIAVDEPLTRLVAPFCRQNPQIRLAACHRRQIAAVKEHDVFLRCRQGEEISHCNRHCRQESVQRGQRMRLPFDQRDGRICDTGLHAALRPIVPPKAICATRPRKVNAAARPRCLAGLHLVTF